MHSSNSVLESVEEIEFIGKVDSKTQFLKRAAAFQVIEMERQSPFSPKLSMNFELLTSKF